MKVLVLNNLRSGFGEGGIYDFIRSMVQDGDEIVMRVSDGATDLGDCLVDAETFDLVVVAGGDGTVANITHALAHRTVPILPFPAGTANLLAMNLASPTEPHALAKLARRKRIIDFDMGEIITASGTRRGFAIMAGAGYDATIMKGAADMKKFLGPIAYFTAAFANPKPQFSEIKVELDDETVVTEGVGVLIINFSRFQFDIAVVHENNPRDGLFDIVIMKTKDAWGLLPAFFATILDRGGDFPDRPDALSIYRSSRVAIEATPPLQIQYDGEVMEETTPFEAKVLPHAAHFVVSQEAEELFSD